jgi:hypothetical protein
VSTSVIPAHLRSIWSQEYVIRSEPFSLTSTPIHRQTVSTPSPPRKVRPTLSTTTRTSTSDVLSSDSLLDMYKATSLDTNKNESTSVEYHTSVIQSIATVKRPHLFNQFDDDTSSRFFSSSNVSQTSVFDAIDVQQSSSSNTAKRFKPLTTNDNSIDNDHQHQHYERQRLSLPISQHSNELTETPTKQTRAVLMRKSSNIVKPLTTDETSNVKLIDEIQSNSDAQVEYILFIFNCCLLSMRFVRSRLSPCRPAIVRLLFI